MIELEVLKPSVRRHSSDAKLTIPSRFLQSRARSSLQVSAHLVSAVLLPAWVFLGFFNALPSTGEVTAIVIGIMCGCVGLAVIVRFIVKTVR